jgi:hypothetical protein
VVAAASDDGTAVSSAASVLGVVVTATT